MNYIELKERAREEAIGWQLTWYDTQYSYGELVYYQDYFEKIGKRYGLLKEFKENCIC